MNGDILLGAAQSCYPHQQWKKNRIRIFKKLYVNNSYAQYPYLHIQVIPVQLMGVLTLVDFQTV